jgi:hypothetical protein
MSRKDVWESAGNICVMENNNRAIVHKEMSSLQFCGYSLSLLENKFCPGTYHEGPEGSRIVALG